MKKLIIFLGLSIPLVFTIWVIEPISYRNSGSKDLSIAASATSTTCEVAPIDRIENLQEGLDAILDGFMTDDDFLGVSVGLSWDACEYYLAGSGYSSKRDGTMATADMVSRIASVTKPMTAIAILQLYEKNLLKLDANIKTYLPELPSALDHGITVRQLLNHTSGVPHYQSDIQALSFSNYSSLEQAIGVIAENGLVGVPGERFVYSSYGYTILGAIVESVSKSDFESYLRKNIWDPAGMTSTSLERSFDSLLKSRLYLKVGGFFIRAPRNDLSIIFPAGGVQSTVGDLLRFGEAILNDQLVLRETLELMIDVRHSLAPAAGDDPYGLGWVVFDKSDAGRIIVHSGAQPGSTAYFQIFLDEGVVVAVLSNAFGTKNASYKLSKELAELAMQGP